MGVAPHGPQHNQAACQERVLLQLRHQCDRGAERCGVAEETPIAVADREIDRAACIQVPRELKRWAGPKPVDRAVDNRLTVDEDVNISGCPTTEVDAEKRSRNRIRPWTVRSE